MDSDTSLDIACSSSSFRYDSGGTLDSTGSASQSSPTSEQTPVVNCVSFSANVLLWDPEAMSFIRTTAAAALAAAGKAPSAASKSTRCYIDVTTTPEGFPQLMLPRLAVPKLGSQMKLEGAFQISPGLLSLHRVAPRVLLCGASACISNAVASREQCTVSDDGSSATMDTIFGLEFETTELEASFVEAIQQLQRKHWPCNQQQPSNKATKSDSGGDPKQNKGHLHQMEAASVASYLGYYARHSTQRDMLRDPTRTAAYRAALSQNSRDIRGKRVMDVGAGSGILSFFSAMQGAQQVYAVEASGMAATARALAEGNPAFGGCVKVLQQPVETVQLGQIGGERVDVLVSEPLGTLLFNERMIESYLFARDNFLKPGGLMFPRRSRLFCAPFTDAALFAEVCSRGAFWQNDNFYGVDLRRAVPAATDEAFRQPIVDYVDPRCLVAEPQCTEFDFASIQAEDLHEVSEVLSITRNYKINLSFTFSITAPCVIHGVATWFTVEFEGSDYCVGFSTGPDGAPTHWFQLRLLMRPPIAANVGQTVKARIKMVATQQQSYKIDGKLVLAGTEFSSTCKDVDLKDPDYRYYTNPAQSYCPSQYPAEAFWSFPSTSEPSQRIRSIQPTASARATAATQVAMTQRTDANAWETWKGSAQQQQQQQQQRLMQRQQQGGPGHQYDEDVAAVNEEMMRVFRPS